MHSVDAGNILVPYLAPVKTNELMPVRTVVYGVFQASQLYCLDEHTTAYEILFKLTDCEMMKQCNSGSYIIMIVIPYRVK